MTDPLPPVFGPESPARLAAAREIGTRSVSRSTRWVVAGSFGLAAVFSAVAASAFSGTSDSATIGARSTTRRRVVVALPPRQHASSPSAPRASWSPSWSPSPAPPVVAPPPAPPAPTGGSGSVVSGGS